MKVKFRKKGGKEMKVKFRKIIATFAVVCTVVTLTSCGGNKKQVEDNSIKYWLPLNSNTAQTTTNLGDTEFAKELMKDVGCEIKFQHPAQGQQGEKFNIMVAMGNMPDIVQFSWGTSYPGGFAKALSDGLICEIDLEKDAPNLAAYIKKHPELDKMIKTNDGKYYGFPFIRGDEYLQTSAGLIVREDWLKDLGIDYPETIDEWTKMLKAFKEKKGAVSPLSVSAYNMSSQGVFVGAYGIFDGLYVDNGKIKYGPIEDGYKDFLIQMNQWYKDGLLDVEFATLDATSIQSKILNGLSGATFGSCGSGIGKWMAAAPDSKFSLAGVKYPVLKKGDKPQFGNYQFPVTNTVAVITKDAKNKELCAKILDYGYSDKGQMLFNFGIQGESYNIIDGYPTYTDNILKNPDGLSMSAALAQYTQAHTEGPFIQDRRYMEQYASLPQQKAALERWIDTDMSKHLMPTVELTKEQQSEIQTIKENIDTYKSEWMVKFIMGVEPITKFDEFRQSLIDRGVEKYIKYNQNAYDLYLKR